MQLYHPDFGLPATRVLFDVSQMLPQFQRLLEFTGDLSLSISAIRYKPATSCVVSYKICIEGVDSFCHAKAFHKDDWSIRKQKLPANEPGVLIDDKHAFALFAFPLDTEIPAVQTLVNDPRSFLSRVFFSRFSAHVPQALFSLAYKPNRRYTVRVDTECGDRFVLKLHDPSTFDQVLKSARALKESRFGHAPVRVGRSRRHYSMIYQWLEGNDVDFSKSDPGQWKPLLEPVFGYLDRLHASAAPSGLSEWSAGHPRGLESLAGYLALIYPPSGARSRRISGHILNNHPVPGPRSFVHGDFHERQIIECGGEIRACDFDNCGRGDPTSDIANFVAHLQLRACLGEVPDSVVKQVEESVLRQIGRQQESTLVERYRWNQIASLFRLATHPFRIGADDWTEQIDQLLEQLERLILEAQNDQSELTKILTWKVSSSCLSLRDQECRTEKEAQLPAKTIQEDPGLAFLFPLFDRKVAQKAIEQSATGVREFYGEFDVQNVVTRRVKPGRRCLFEFVLSTENGPRSILGKASAKRLDRKTHEVQSALFHDLGFGPDCPDELMVPHPLGLLEPWNMWLQEKVSAQSASQYLKASCLDNITGQLALAIAKLHNSTLLPRGTHRVSDELRILTDRLTCVSVDRPGDSGRIQRIIKNCTAIGKWIDETKTVPVHRDFYQDQILLAGTRTWLVDLDLVSLGHPALDIGNFLAHLTEHGLRKHNDPQHWNREAAEFTRRYIAVMPNVTAREIASFEAISLARHIYISWSRPERKCLVGKMIQETERTIEFLIPRPDLCSPLFLQPCLEF